MRLWNWVPTTQARDPPARPATAQPHSADGEIGALPQAEERDEVIYHPMTAFEDTEHVCASDVPPLFHGDSEIKGYPRRKALTNRIAAKGASWACEPFRISRSESPTWSNPLAFIVTWSVFESGKTR